MKDSAYYKIGNFPCWIHQDKNAIQHYGLPDVTGIGIKLAQHGKDSEL